MSTSPRGRGHRCVKTWLFPSALGEAASACPTETITSRGWHDVIKNFWSVDLQQKIQNSELLGVGRWGGETSAIEDDLESQLLESKDCAVPTSCTRNSQHSPNKWGSVSSPLVRSLSDRLWLSPPSSLLHAVPSSIWLDAESQQLFIRMSCISTSVLKVLSLSILQFTYVSRKGGVEKNSLFSGTRGEEFLQGM